MMTVARSRRDRSCDLDSFRRLSYLTTNLSTAKGLRRVVVAGRNFLVAHVNMIVPGVLAGSKGALFYPPEHVQANVDAWNGMPVVINHPMIDGQNVSARSPEVMEKQWVGNVFHTYFSQRSTSRDPIPGASNRPMGILSAEAWIDVDNCSRIAPKILRDIQNGKPIEVSTGLYTDNIPEEGVYNGKSYNYRAVNYKPDHLAILPDQVGACSTRDGCGINVNSKKKDGKDEGGGRWVTLEGGQHEMEATIRARIPRTHHDYNDSEVHEYNGNKGDPTKPQEGSAFYTPRGIAPEHLDVLVGEDRRPVPLLEYLKQRGIKPEKADYISNVATVLAANIARRLVAEAETLLAEAFS